MQIDMITCANPLAQYMEYKKRIDAAVSGVLASGRYILGDEVKAFEQELAVYLDVPYAIGCGSGTDALVLALRALDIGTGDEVIVPSHTAVPTVAAIAIVGAIPRFVDIEPGFFTIDPACIEVACSANTKAIIAVHLYGQSAAIGDIADIARRHNLYLIEDCAQAIGATYQGKKLGTIGDIGCFSFFPTKNLGAIGDGGAIVCKDQLLATRINRLRQYGWNNDRISEEPGINSRLDELQAAVLRVKLEFLDNANKQRKHLADIYSQSLGQLPLSIPIERAEAEHVYHLYVVQTGYRDTLIEFLKEHSVNAGIHYATPIHKMPAFKREVALPATEKAAAMVLSLPLYPGMEMESQKYIIKLIHTFFENKLLE